MSNFTLSHTTKTYPKLAYERIKDDVLGRSYCLSLVFVGSDRAAKLNQSTRGKSYVPNVLSFPLDDSNGEIFITPQAAEREAKKYGHTFQTHIIYLFIHGLLHLKGYDHGVKMEALEKKYLAKYKVR